MDRRRELPLLPSGGGIQLPPIHTLAPLPAPVARPAAFAVAHRTPDGHQAYDYGDLHETASGGGYSYYSSAQTPAPRDPMIRPRPSFPITIAPPVHHAPRPHPPPSRKFVHAPATYIPPAHPHSHHLHSIPPRDKSTRTLILDHLLWMHARARFGAARGELGVGTRPHFDAKDACLETLEDHGVMGLGLFEEGLDKLSYPDTKPTDPDPDGLALGPPDLALATAYRAKATGLEKVLTAMLDQSPVPDPTPDDDDMVVDSGLSSGSVTCSHKLPNSVRLRLALSLLANELFSPEPEPPSTSAPQAPPALLSLAQLAPPPPASLLCPPSPPVTLPSFQQFTSGAPAIPQSIFNSIPRGQGVEGPWTYPRTGPAPAYFRDGVLEDPYTPQTQRCVRHLSRTCQAPTCAYVPAPLSSASSRPAMVLGVQPGRTSTIGAGLGRSGGPPLRLARTDNTQTRRMSMSMSVSPPTVGLGISGTVPQDSRLTALISRFLRLSALVAIELGREARGEEDGFGTRSAPSPPPAAIKIPNAGPYLPASSGSSTDGSDDESPNPRKRTVYVGGRPIAGSVRAGKLAKPSVHAHARPTRVWYALLCGLVTRACLEGYLMRGWKSTLGAEILFRIGAKPDGPSDGQRKFTPQEERDLGAYEAREKALAAMYDPDEMPSLDEAGRILFARGNGEGSEEEEEWEREIKCRLVEFTTVPNDIPSLGTHLESLASRYPTEPVERAALRFCESVARWRGKPELETYKKSVPLQQQGPSIPIDQLINIPMSTQPKPPIERYFHLPIVRTPVQSSSPASSATPTNSKRPRSNDESAGPSAKKVNVEGYVEVEEWVGPYGI
ncbi:hypothetical protein V565_057630 [Rhizoctonia solani 123E]|uniref:Uncharacterized protein n=1 Tax=Rhizoctonia solani 123E TaxID=1423351 RepID=A0A074S2A6_9AGAM|nr:hypothetical protein V565_057630 [Rhizoctonia solani 123E]